MATKAELEAELATLRAELAARDRPEKAEENDEDKGGKDEGAGLADNLEKDIGEILADLEDLPNKQPLLFALGAFAVGFMLGRSR